MKKKTVQKSAFVLIVAVLLSCLAGMAALSIDFGSDRIDLDDTTKATSRYLPVTFDHKTHIEGYGITCVTCHHEESDSFISGTTPKCGVCHNAESTVSFKDSMHKRCVVCHITENEAGKQAPTECLTCHAQRP